LLLVIQGTGLYHITSVFAGDSSTSASVNNKVPTFTDIPYEDPASTSTAPTNVGTNVTFKTKANDKNVDQYYLAICEETGITAGNDGPPTCTGTGAEFCYSTATDSDAVASCTYQVASGDVPSQAWYGYVCDKNASALCTSVNSGTGDSGTPFYVNSQPTFTVFADDAPVDPGATVTWTSTASDADGDLLELYVCKTQAFSGGVCTGGEWCHDTTPQASNPTCSVAMASIMQDGDHGAYGYIIDAHDSVASGGSQGTDSVLTINNIAPTITDSTIFIQDTDGEGDMTLTSSQGETTGFKVVFAVTDTNSCLNLAAGQEISSAVIDVRRSGVIATSCDATVEYNANYCYPDDYASWTTSCTQTGTCSGATDSTIEWTCTFPLQYHADPTVADSTYAAEWWIADVKATDDDTANTGWVTSSDADGTEMGQFMDYHLNTATIVYGSLDPGADATEQSTVLEATGNVGLDENLSGTILTSGGNTIAIANQHYNLTASLGWVAGTALSGTAAEAELNLGKTVDTLTPLTKSTYWVLRVPDPQATGSYTGTNTIVGKVGEYTDW
jgi:hypothetical protein